MDYETPQFYRVMERAAAADRDVVDLVSGSPDWEPPAGIRAGLREYADAEADAFDYPPSEGLAALREAIGRRRGVDPERVIVTNGTGEANHLATTAALDRGDGNGVVLPDPVYPYYAGRATLLDAETTFVPVADDGRVRPAAVRAATDDGTAAVVIATPNNPTGATYDENEVAALARIAEDRDAVLISDEVYRRFDRSGRFASALSTGSPNVVVTGGFSKSMAITGLRVGYAVLPDPAGPTGDLLDAARTRHMLTNVTTSRPAQRAVLRALETTGEGYYERARERVARRIETLCSALDDVGAGYRRPDGAFYVLADLPGVPGTFEGAYDLIDEVGVAAMPGEAFGSARADGHRFAVLSPRVEEAADRLRASL